MNEKEILELLLSKITNVDDKIASMDNKIANMDNKIDNLENNMNNKFDNLQGQIDVISNEVINIKATLENEINRNIRVIAEGHENLNYKLDKAVQYSNKMELMEIRINRLESEVDKLKKFA